MRVAFRVDASVSTGTGHVVRCTALANALRRRGADVLFICRDLPGNLVTWLRKSGHRTELLPPMVGQADATAECAMDKDVAESLAAMSAAAFRADWLVVDHYSLNEYWESRLRPAVGAIFAIDDLADRRHDCDLLLDQNPYLSPELRYREKVPPHCRQLLGPRYALMRREFIEARKTLAGPERPALARVLVFFGGSDPTHETEKALDAIQRMQSQDWEFDLVVGQSNPRREIIESRCRTLKSVSFSCQVDDMAARMCRAQLALGAGGSTALERCVLGLPALTIVTAGNQVELTGALNEKGAIWYLGRSEEVAAEEILCALISASAQRERLQHIARSAWGLFESSGADGCGEVAQILLERAHG